MNLLKRRDSQYLIQMIARLFRIVDGFGYVLAFQRRFVGDVVSTFSLSISFPFLPFSFFIFPACSPKVVVWTDRESC